MLLSSVYKFFSSVKLALVLLVAILVCCVIGVVLLPEEQARAAIFGALWFNALLVLLVVNVSCYFFPRVLKRKLTLTSAGMMLFHLSFVAILAGIVYNSMFNFRAQIRLTEGETLSDTDPGSYDKLDHGRFFNFGKLKGETTLVRVYPGYMVGANNKRVAYELAVGGGNPRKQGIIYTTKTIDDHGFTYYCDKEGFSLLLILYDKQGKELYGAYVPLQSLKQKDGSYLYTSGMKGSPGVFLFPQYPEKPVFFVQMAFKPSGPASRDGEITFQVWPYNVKNTPEGKPAASGKASVGSMFDAGGYLLSARQVRYWAAVDMRYEPGKPIVLSVLWAGLLGIVMTFIGRLKPRKLP